MKILNILSQHRRDFTAILICEHCSKQEYLSCGYDDDNYHRNVIPNLECRTCKKKSPEDYKPLETKYQQGVQI